jgi:hypothetical protein
MMKNELENSPKMNEVFFFESEIKKQIIKIAQGYNVDWHHKEYQLCFTLHYSLNGTDIRGGLTFRRGTNP